MLSTVGYGRSVTTAEQPRARRRRAPAEAEHEILDAAEEALAEGPFRQLTVEELTRRTGMRRSGFYHYFASLDEVIVALLGRVRTEMMAAAHPWFDAAEDADPVAAIRRVIGEVAAIYARHGRVLGAIQEASASHDSVHAAWRDGVLGGWMRVVADELRRQRDLGLTQVRDPDELARALILMNSGVFLERLATRTPDAAADVAELLADVWVAAIYSGAPTPHQRPPQHPSDRGAARSGRRA